MIQYRIVMESKNRRILVLRGNFPRSPSRACWCGGDPEMCGRFSRLNSWCIPRPEDVVSLVLTGGSVNRLAGALFALPDSEVRGGFRPVFLHCFSAPDYGVTQGSERLRPRFG